MLTHQMLRKISEFFSRKVPDAQWTTLKSQFLKALNLNEMELGNELAKALADPDFRSDLTNDEWVSLSKKMNHGPLYHAVAAKISGPDRKKHFPEIAHKFEDTTTANVASYPVPIGMLRRKKRQAKFRSAQK